MTPQEKAKELVDKFQKQIFFEITDERLDINESKGCALIAVEEIIKSKKLNYLFTQNQINSMEMTSDDRWIYETFIDYWEEVKHEIEKL